jgi:hypothetical protein
MRGPHVTPRKDGSPEGVASDHRETTPGFGGGL